MNGLTGKKGRLMGKIVVLAVAGMILLALSLCAIALIQISNGYHKMGEEVLKASCLQLQENLDNMYLGEWHIVDGKLFKGQYEMESSFQPIMDGLSEKTGLEYTIIIDKTRAMTTIDGMKGKDIGDAAYNSVKAGQPFTDFKTVINGKKYYVYYSPEFSDGKYVGCFFAGRLAEDINKDLNIAVGSLLVLGVIVTVLFSILGVFITNKYGKMMKDIARGVNDLAGGDLNARIDSKLKARNDELGIIASGVGELEDRLQDIISRSVGAANDLDKQAKELAESSSQASLASDQVTEAINGISKGAVAQAESVESAVADTDDIGRNIENINGDVQEMDRYAEEMKEACDKAMDALDKLIEHSEEVTRSVKDIGDTITSTNESAKTISEFTQAITDIATQTNLLSLNASIEAARAGDAGRGFAVVADEIRKLADQSSESAEKIKSIVEKLLADSASSVNVLEKLNESFGVQAAQLDSTKNNMEVMNGNVAYVKDTSAHITGRISSLNDSKNGLTGVINDLSAVSEENAASTEETNASMEELNATFTLINDAAVKLQTLSEDLAGTMNYFKL